MLRCSVATLFRSWLASLAVGLMTLASQVRAQRHSRIARYIVFRHIKIVIKIKFASFFCSYAVSKLANFNLKLVIFRQFPGYYLMLPNFLKMLVIGVLLIFVTMCVVVSCIIVNNYYHNIMFDQQFLKISLIYCAV